MLTTILLNIRIDLPYPLSNVSLEPSTVMRGSRCLGGIVRTRKTDSPILANTWPERHPLNSAVEVLHDPKGPGVKIAGEPASLVYPWQEIFGMSGWMIFFLVLLTLTQRRLQFLQTLPEDYDASPPPSAKLRGPNDLIDLKLS